MITAAEAQRLKDRVEALEYVVGLRMPRQDEWAMRELLRASGQHPGAARLLGMLFARDLVSIDGATIALGEHEPRSPELVEGYLRQVRKALRPHGIKVDNMWNRGWTITPPNKRKLRALLDKIAIA